MSVAVDASGNMIIAGFFLGTANFGGSNLVSAGSFDVFVAKYNASGVHQWSQRFGSTTSDGAYSVAVDGSGAIMVAGTFSGTVSFGGANLVSGGGQDIFMARYTANGVHQWSKGFGAAGNEGVPTLGVDGSGNIMLTGSFFNTVNFGGVGLVSGGAGDVFLAKYNSAGVHQWSQSFSGPGGGDAGEHLAIDGSGNVVLIGQFQGTVNFGGSGLVSAGIADVFLAKYDGAGTHQWSQSFGDVDIDVGRMVSVTSSGDVFATGDFGGTVDFGGDPLVSAGSYDIFLAAYDASGAHQWSHRFGGTGVDLGNGVAVDEFGQVFASGQFFNTVDFGGGALISAGLEDVYLIKYSTSGVHQWSRRFGSTASDVGREPAEDRFGGVAVPGSFNGTVDFGGGGLISAGGTDIFLVRYGSDAEPRISSIIDVGNDQGRNVKIAFYQSGHDHAADPDPIIQYEAFRRSDPLPSVPALLAPGSVSVPGWAFVGAVPAHGEVEYEIYVPTLADSTIAQGQFYSAFFIRAATSPPTLFYDSAPDSGYSLDDLAPSVPTSFVYLSGDLTWNEVPEPDFDYFTVYGSNTDSFGSSNVVDYTVDPELIVNASPYTFYFVTATDLAGNEGKPARVNTLSGTGGRPTRYVLSVSNHPNPFNPSTTVGYTVPARGVVTVAIYDLRGARVATLVDGENRTAGAYTIPWDGRDTSGAVVSSGIYFARIEQNGITRARKLTLLK